MDKKPLPDALIEMAKQAVILFGQSVDDMGFDSPVTSALVEIVNDLRAAAALAGYVEPPPIWEQEGQGDGSPAS